MTWFLILEVNEFWEFLDVIELDSGWYLYSIMRNGMHSTPHKGQAATCTSALEIFRYLQIHWKEYWGFLWFYDVPLYKARQQPARLSILLVELESTLSTLAIVIGIEKTPLRDGQLLNVYFAILISSDE
jgi:hypothetical protein